MIALVPVYCFSITFTHYLACNDKKAFFTDHEGYDFRMYLMPYRISWIIFKSVLAIDNTDKLVLRLVQNVLLLLPFCVYFHMKEISRLLFW